MPGGQSGDQFAHFTLSQRNALQLIVIVTTSFSLLGSSLELLAFAVFSARRRELGPLRLWMWLALSDWLSSVANMVGLGVYYGEPPTWVCTTQGALIQFSNLAAVLWTAALAHSFYFVVCKADMAHSRFELWYQLVCWLVPLALSLANLHNYGPSGNWCWITSEHQLYRFLTYYVLVVFSFGACAIVLTRGMLVLYRSDSVIVNASLMIQRRRALHRRMLMILFVFLVCYTGSLFLRISELAGRNDIYAFAVLQAVTNPLQGGLNAILFFAVRRVRREVALVCPCCARFECCQPDERDTLPLLLPPSPARINTP